MLISSLRNHHESNVEWQLRKKFLKAHWNNFSEDRLICLASCYVNVKCYQCRYPPAVMEQLRQLGEGLSDEEDDDDDEDVESRISDKKTNVSPPKRKKTY